jgi:hypothetical protein
MRSLLRVIRAMLVMGIACLAQPVLATDPATHSIYIPAQDLGTALLKFATATHQQIAFDHKLVEGYWSTALSGTYTVTEGAQALIGTAPFLIRTTPSGVLTVAAAPAALAGGDARSGAAQSPAPLDAEGTSADASAEVVVSAQRRWAERAALAPKLSAFVFGIAGIEKGERLARWQRPVCPLVAGLSQPEGEFILARVSEIAHAAGVSLAAENCRPNLYVLVTSQPKELLQRMQKRNRIFTFGVESYPAVIDEFINTPRPVRVWYNTYTEDAWGLRPSAANPEAVESDSAIWEADSSRLLSNVVYKFSRIFVVVDLTRMHGVSLGQLADYVGIVGLAEIKPTAHLGDAQTILQLFSGAPEAAAPTGMSDWDQAFLKTLYGTPRPLAQERSFIARHMVSEIIP